MLTVTIKAGTNTGSFRITTMPVNTSVQVEVIARSSQGEYRKTLTILPPELKSFTIAPRVAPRGSVRQGSVNVLPVKLVTRHNSCFA
jgi:hypothetical protein